jgi:phage terminase large subunit GpA-like protein
MGNLLECRRWKIFCPRCGHSSKLTGDKDEVYVLINKPCEWCRRVDAGVDAVELS